MSLSTMAQLKTGVQRSKKPWMELVQAPELIWWKNTHNEPDIHMGPYQLWDVPDIEGNLDETPVAPGADILAAVMIWVPQAD